MKQRLWLSLVTCLAYCIDKELYKAIDYLREQVRVLVEHQEKQDKRIMLTNRQRMRGGRQSQTAKSKYAGTMYGVVYAGHNYAMVSETHC
jgi:hypothetical protein